MKKIQNYIGIFFFLTGVIIIILFFFGIIEYDKNTLIKFKEKDELLDIFPENYQGFKAELNVNDLGNPVVGTPKPAITTQKVTRSKTYEEFTLRAEKLALNGYPNLAINEYLKASEEENEIAEPYLKIGDLYVMIKEYDKALESYQKGLEHEPQNVDLQIKIGKVYLQKREITQAQQFFSTLPDTNEIVIYYKAIISAYFQDNQSAFDLFIQIQSSTQDENLKSKASNFIDAYNEFNLTKEGQSSYLKALLARAYIKSEEYEVAIPLLYDSIKENEDYRELWILLGYAYLKLENYTDSIEALEEAKKFNSDKPETLFYLGLAFFGEDDLDKAILNVKNSIEKGYEPVIQAKQKLAEFYYWKNDYDKAVEIYEQVINENGDSIDYFVRPVYIYIEILKKPDKALELAKKALALHPDNAMTYNLLGWAYISNNKISEAKSNIEKALNIDPNLSAGYLNLGQILELEGKIEEAKNNYKKAHEIGNGNSISNLAAEKYNNLIQKEQEQKTQNEPLSDNNI